MEASSVCGWGRSASTSWVTPTARSLSSADARRPSATRRRPHLLDPRRPQSQGVAALSQAGSEHVEPAPPRRAGRRGGPFAWGQDDHPRSGGRGSSQGAVGHTQLGEHAHQVGLDPRLRDGQLPADRPVGEAARHQGQHLDVVETRRPGDARCTAPAKRASPSSVAGRSPWTTTKNARRDSCFLAKEESWLTAWYARSLPIRTNTSREPVVADVPNSDGSSTSQRHQWLRTRANGIDGPLDETGGAGRKIGEQNVPLIDDLRTLDRSRGTGYYTLEVADALAPGGRLEIFDVQQQMLDHTMRRAGAAA